MGRSGKDILSDIDGQAEVMRGYILDLNQKVSKANARIESLNEEEAGTYIELAELRFELLDDPDITDQISHAEKKAKSSLDARQKRRFDLGQALVENQEEQKSLEQKRMDLSSGLDDFSAKVEAEEQSVLRELDNNPVYSARLNHIKEIEAQIKRVENKISIVQDDYHEKAKPYQDDVLFIYLWGRGFGTSAYKASSLFRVLDHWVAKIASYEEARCNYAILSTIPEKIMQHKTHLEEQIDVLEAEQEQQEKEHFETKGVAKLQEEYDTRWRAVEKIDERLADMEGQHKEILQDKEEFIDNSDEFYSSAIETLRDIYKSKSLHNLRRNVAITATKEDDKLIQRLYGIDEEIDETESMISTYNSSLRQENWRLTELQSARKTFKQKKYDSKRTSFGDGNMFNILLGQFITGILTNAHFWSAIGRIAVNIMDDIDLDDFGKSGRHSRHSRRKYRHSSKRSGRSKGGFRTGGKF